MTCTFSWQNSFSLCLPHFVLQRQTCLLFHYLLWRRKWQPTPVLLPGESLGHRSLVGYSPWDHRVGHDWVTDTHTTISWLPTFAFLSPMMKRTYFFGVSFRMSCRSSWNHSSSGFSALVVRGIDLDCCDVEWFALETNQHHCHLWDYNQVLHFGLFCWLWGLLHFF